MTVRIWTKTETQKAIKALRDAGLPVERNAHSGIYELNDRHGRNIFRALPGTRGYLVKHHDELFTDTEAAISA